MTKLQALVILILFSITIRGQYSFEKLPPIKSKEYNNWKTSENIKGIANTLTIPNFFQKGEELTIKLTSYSEHLFENSLVEIFYKNLRTNKFLENINFNPTGLSSIKVIDINNDGLKDIKIIENYMGNGIASLNIKIIYLIQKSNHKFEKISFNDKEGENTIERDFDGDGKYEIITKTLAAYQNHSYWVFNLYNYKNNGFINVNKKSNYPIMVQFLDRDNYSITDKISREKMKRFTMDLPEEYSNK